MNSRPGRPSPHDIGALVSLVDQDRLSEAESRVRRLLAEHPDEGMLWKILSVAQVRQGKDALTALRRTTELMPNDAEAHRNLAAAWQGLGQWENALSSLHRALQIEPHDADGFAEAADALRALGRLREAVPLYERALLLNPKSVEARNNLGNAFLELGRNWDAARCYRMAVEARPDDPVILCNLGNAQRLLGLLDEARISLLRSVALRDNLSIAHHYLGLVHAALGQREAAVSDLSRALATSPGNAAILTDLGFVLRDLGRRREAVAAFEQAIAADPSRADSHCNLGNVLFDLRRIEAAVDCFRRALVLRPDFAPAHLSLGLALRQQRRPIEAEASCRAALAIDPDYVDALSFLGELHADRGEFAAAEKLFRQVVAVAPDFAVGYASIATHRKMTTDDTDWLRGVEAALKKPQPIAHEIGLRYALGKYFDDLARYDEAFEQYARANALARRDGPAHDRDQLTRRIDGIIETFDAASLASCRAYGSTSERPIFIIGMPRSGTSLAEQILASHPAVYGAGEVIFWHAAYDGQRAAGGSPAAQVAALGETYLKRLASLDAAALRVVDKMPANFLYAGLIHAALPRARIIHLRRHPFDTCLSIYFQNFFNIGPYAHDLHDLMHYYSQYLRITGHWRGVLPKDAFLEVDYESLVADQERSTRRLLEFVGLPWDERCLEFHNTDRVVITASKWQVRQKMSSSSVGRWRHYEKYVAPLAPLLALLPDARR